MPNYMTPGVYAEEVPSTQKPIEGVGTAVAAFVGLAPGGPLNEPRRIAGWPDFADTFSDPAAPDNGPFMEGAFLAHSVYGFFQNGGQVCWVVRVGADTPPEPPRAAIGTAGENGSLEAVGRGAELTGPITVTVREESAKSNGKADDKPADAAPTFAIDIAGPDGQTEAMQNLKTTTLVKEVNARSTLIKLEGSGAPALTPGTYALERAPVPAAPIEAETIIGDTARREGIGCLAAIEEITIVCVPDAVTLAPNGDDSALRAIQSQMLAHCEAMGDRMAILDPPESVRRPQEILEWRAGSVPESKFGTLYYPWVQVRDPITRRSLNVPPCGHVAGVWARSDGTRGVHKAPANEVIRGATGLAFQLAQAEQGQLNFDGINCIRVFPGRGVCIWGARTLSKSDPEWRYLNVRRLFNWVVESLVSGTVWAVFEPNDERLWMRLRVATSSFLTRAWRDGMLFGATPAEAFYVQCDPQTHRQEDIDAGRVTIEVGIAPVKPAEFVVFRISQTAPGEQPA